jgi:tyrosyl-tRNA synthetase
VSASFTSKSAVRRLIEQGGLEVNGEKAVDPAREIVPEGEIRLKIGKKEFVILTFA